MKEDKELKSLIERLYGTYWALPFNSEAEAKAFIFDVLTWWKNR